MTPPRLEAMQFGPRVPFVRLGLVCFLFVLLWPVLAGYTRDELAYGGGWTPGLAAEVATGACALVAFFGVLASYLLLPFRLRFTEEGLYRRTLWQPRFVPWGSVLSAQIGTYRGYFALELWVSPRRWICIPLIEYRRSASLFAELSRRLPVPVAGSEAALAVLRDG